MTAPEDYDLLVNGTEHHVVGAWIGESLLYVLRERLGLPGAKNACEQGECGSCSVMVDDSLVCSCLVLAASAVGFSMGAAGTDTAKEAADVLIMNDDLRKVPETIRLSQRTYAVLWQNITLALGIKAVFFVLAVFGSATCGWPSLRTWARACWWCSTACGC